MNHKMGDMKRRPYGTGQLTVQNGRWFARWYEGERRRSRMLGPVKSGGSGEGLTKREAEGLLRGILLEVESVMVVPRGASVLVRDLAATHLSLLVKHGRKPSHIRSTGYHVSTWIDPALGDSEVADVDRADVRRLVERMIRDGRSPKMVRNVIGTLHSIMRLAVERELRERNPVEHVRLPKVAPQTELRFLTHPEVARVLAAAPGDDVTQAERDQWPVTRLLILTAVLSGLRLGELRGLRWHDLDLGASKIRVRHSFVRGELSSPKSRRSIRAVPLSTVLMDELDSHHRSTVWNQDQDFVLAHPHTGRPLSETRLREHFHHALERADVRPVRIHDLRHTFATIIAASGEVSIRTLQEWMGHESITTTQRYADYFPGHDEAAKLDRALGGDIAQSLPNYGQQQPSEMPESLGKR